MERRDDGTKSLVEGMKSRKFVKGLSFDSIYKGNKKCEAKSLQPHENKIDWSIIGVR